jgi:hypothetical protein
LAKHGVRFEVAVEVFFDRAEDAERLVDEAATSPGVTRSFQATLVNAGPDSEEARYLLERLELRRH